MEIIQLLRDFLDKGGDVLFAILFLSIWLSWLIIDRYHYFFRDHEAKVQEVLLTWQSRAEKKSWFALVARKHLIYQVALEMERGLKLIPAIIALLPMFGLLGTVTGMIQVFDVMAIMGSGNPRAMADGVSAATIPTMSGMVIALAAIPFSTQLDRIYKQRMRRLEALLVIGD